MAKIYDPPKEMGPIPQISHDWKAYEAECEKYMKSLTSFCKKYGKGKYRGKVVKEHVADGYAMYVVFTSSPVQLIHIPLYDAWEFKWAHKWNAKDIKEMVEREESMQKLFAKEASQ